MAGMKNAYENWTEQCLELEAKRVEALRPGLPTLEELKARNLPGMSEKQLLLDFMRWLELNKYKGKDLECFVESFLNHREEAATLRGMREEIAKICLSAGLADNSEVLAEAEMLAMDPDPQPERIVELWNVLRGVKQ
jgi:hypothetical protein